ncbi:hypothetical protein N7445_008227 [Penicillium cf. griseofulvum]|nr:hypothetical protein N7445_008227 [Penicillium cf. griseofulvum]
MSSLGNTALRLWFQTLSLPQQSHLSWHRARLREELCERRTAKTSWQKLSETSDVLFSITRSQYDGFLIRNPSCFSCLHSTPIYLYITRRDGHFIKWSPSSVIPSTGIWYMRWLIQKSLPDMRLIKRTFIELSVSLGASGHCFHELENMNLE